MGREFAPRSHDQRAKNRDERPEYLQNVVGIKFDDEFSTGYKANCRSKRQSIYGIKNKEINVLQMATVEYCGPPTYRWLWSSPQAMLCLPITSDKLTNWR